MPILKTNTGNQLGVTKGVSPLLSPRFSSEEKAIPLQLEKKGMEIPLKSLISGFSRQFLKGNFAFFRAFISYQKDLKLLSQVLRDTESIGKTLGKPTRTFSQNDLKRFVTALRGGASGLQATLVTLGAEKETISLQSGMELFLKEFDGVPKVKFEQPIYGELLTHLETQAKQSQRFLSYFPGGTSGVEQLFTQLRKAAMPSIPLSESIRILNEAEGQLKNDAEVIGSFVLRAKGKNSD